MASTTTTDTAVSPAAAATSSSGGGGNQFFSLFRAHDVPVTSVSSSPSSSDGGGGGSGADGPSASTAPKQQQEQLTIFALSSNEPTPPAPAVGGAVTSNSSAAAARPGLLLVHGYPQTSHIWRLVADELVQSGKWEGVVVVDLRGEVIPASISPRARWKQRERKRCNVAAAGLLALRVSGQDQVGHPQDHIPGPLRDRRKGMARMVFVAARKKLRRPGQSRQPSTLGRVSSVEQAGEALLEG